MHRYATCVLRRSESRSLHAPFTVGAIRESPHACQDKRKGVTLREEIVTNHLERQRLMTTTIAQIAEVLQALLTSKADELGRQSGFIQRQKKFSGSSFAQTLVFGWLANPQSTMEELSQSAANVGVTVSRQGINERFSRLAASFMGSLVQEALKTVVYGKRVATPILSRFEKVYLMDATIINLPDELAEVWTAYKGAGLKISLSWELLRGAWEQVHWHSAHEHDQQAPLVWEDLPTGTLVLRDLGYFKLKSFQAMSEYGLYWLSRYKVGTLVFLDGERLNLLAWLREQAQTTADVAIELGLRQRVKCRLIAKPVPREILRQRQAQLKEWERKKQTKASAERWNLLGWSLYLTNASQDLLTADEVSALLRSRWQIEKVFYWWKDDGEIDEWRTTNPWRILCEVYAKFFALLIQHWLMIRAEIHDVRRSTLQASSSIRKQAWHLAFVLNDHQTLIRVLRHIVNCLKGGCRISASATSPPTFQLFYP